MLGQQEQATRAGSQPLFCSLAAMGAAVVEKREAAPGPSFTSRESEEHVKVSYRDNYERLAAIKGTDDPTNFFHVNQNIKPAH